MGAADTARTVIGVIGNVISFALFASPAPTFWRIWKNKSVEEFKPDPYIATVMNCMFWIFYGIPVVHPDSTLVVTINSVGLAVELIYLTIYFIFAPNIGRLKVIGWLCLEVAFMAVVIVITLIKFHTHDSRSNFVGVFCVVFGVLMYASPLTIMKKVIKTKSVEYMPFYLSLANFLNGVIWLTYALIKFDLYITIGNGLGVVSGTIQLILYACYYKSTPKAHGKEKEKGKYSEMELASPKRPNGTNQPTPPTAAPAAPAAAADTNTGVGA